MLCRDREIFKTQPFNIEDNEVLIARRETLQCSNKCLTSVPTISFLLKVQKEANTSLLLSTSSVLISLVAICGDSRGKKSTKSCMTDVTWECIGILLYYCHQITTEPQFARLAHSLIAISQKVVNEDATDVNTTSERILMEVIIFALAEFKVDLLQHVSSASRQVDPIIQLIVVVAGTVSAFGQLNLKNIFSTLYNIRETSCFTDLSHVRVNAKSVRSVIKTLRIMRQGLSTTEVTSKSIKSPSQLSQNICLKEQEKEKPTLNTRRSQNEIAQIVQMTNFDEVVFPINKPVPDTITTNRHSTSDFLKLFIKYKICSQRHFLHMLDNDTKLMDAYLHLPYNLTNQIIAKGLTVAQSAFTPTTFLDKFNDTVIDESKPIKRLTGLFYEYLQYISHTNFYPRDELLHNIFNVLLMKNNKRITLGFIGPSNTGKTFLADIISGSFNSFEIGNILPPSKDTLDTFWLSNCVYSSIKRMEEFFIPTQSICNAFKQLLEGNRNQIANVKYKDNLNLPTTPTILTMNGNSKTDSFTPLC